MDTAFPSAFAASPAVAWGNLYHFLELALAHPAEEGIAYFRLPETEEALERLLEDLSVSGSDLSTLRAFFAGLRGNDATDVEAAHIGLFSANFPQVPCPPYGSLFTAEDDGKRLEEMLAIKQFYAEDGVDVSESFDDLPDHLCVELEFLQLLCFREHDALAAGDAEMAEAVRARQALFLDRFLLPFVERLALLAVRTAPDNPYAHLVDATWRLLAHHRARFPEVQS
jgi:TorA maturation chaperone TorD